MSDFEAPERQSNDYKVSVEDIRELKGASTPHFALQIRKRIERLIEALPIDHPARIEGEQELARLNKLAMNGVQSGPVQEGERPMPSLAAGKPGTRLRA